MKIKNQFIISIIIFLCIFIVISASIFFTSQSVLQLSAQRDLARSIQTGAADLSYLSNDYFLFRDEPLLESWHITYDSIWDQVSKINPVDPYRQTLVEDIEADLLSLNSTFHSGLALIENAAGNESVLTTSSFQLAWSRLGVQSQALAFEVHLLLQSLSGATDQLQMTNIALIIILLSVFGAYFVINYIVTYRKTLKSISQLQTGLAVIGSGNLDYSLKAGKKDEIGEISGSVNQMTANLKSVTASKLELEKEICERKKAQEALKASEQRWVTTLSSIGDAVIATDVVGKVTFMNNIAEALTGWPLEKAHQRPLNEVFHVINEYTRQEIQSPVERVLKTGNVVGLANHSILVLEDGIEVPIDDSASPIIDQNGQVTGVVLVFHDISDRRKAEKELVSLSRFPSENPYAVFRVSREGTVIYANPASQKLPEPFKLKEGKIVPKPWLERITEVFLTKRKIDFEENVAQNWYFFAMVPIFPEGYINFYGIDITERKKNEQELERYRKSLEQLVEQKTKQLRDTERLAAIGATAGMVGHDIRNPLQAITSDLFLAKSDLASMPDNEEKESIQESLDEIQKSIDYINKIVADLQDFARPLSPHTEELDLENILDGVLKKSGLSEKIKASVKVESEAKTIRGDPDLLNRIMNNLVNNAIQAMPNGGKLAIQAYKEASDVVIAVKDTGIGIPEAAKSKLFTPMFTTKSKGQGFGLAVVKRMTEALGGTVAFKSKQGKGTTFIVRLPQKSEVQTF